MTVAIFDMDGLLIDSEPLWRAAEIDVFGSCGVSLTDEMCRLTMGLRVDEVVAWWFERFPWRGKSHARVAAEIVEGVRQLLARHGTLLPGVRETLEALLDAGWRLAVASSSPPVLIEAAVHGSGLGDAFEHLVSANDEPQGKPHPGVYLTAARLLGVDARTCIAFEDSVVGLRSARAAGMRVVAVPSPESYDDPAFEDAQWKLRSLEDFELSLLAAGTAAAAAGMDGPGG